MLSVNVIRREPLDETHAASLTAAFGHKANALATIEYRFDDAICIRVEDVPVRYDAESGRQYIHARIGGPIFKEVMRLAEAARQQTPSHDAPVNLTIAAPALLPAA